MWMMSEHGAKWELEDQPFKKGGEGGIHRIVGQEKLVAKIYQEGALTQTRQEKLAYMASVYSPSLRQLAWPQEVFRDPYGNVKGFVMRRFDATEDMADLLDGTGGHNAIDWRKRVVVALNLSYLVQEIHTMGQVIGDMNPKNFGVDMNSGFVCAFDTDSFHIYNRASRKWYPCTVLDEHYIAPELQARLQQGIRVDSFRPEETFTIQTDCFALAVLIFQLLFLGVHPFTAARVASRGSSVLIHRRETNIYQRMCPFFNPAPNVTIPVYAPPLEIVPLSFRQLFRKAFLEDDRPAARDWAEALSQLMLQTEKCPRGHYYARFDEKIDCPWCRMENKKATAQVSPVQQHVSPLTPAKKAPPQTGYTLKDRARTKPFPVNQDRKREGYYDGSSPERAIIIDVKVKAGTTERKYTSPRGDILLPAGLYPHEMLHYTRGPKEHLYVLQNLNAPYVFTWICAAAAGVGWYLSDQEPMSLFAGTVLGMMAGAFLDNKLTRFWIQRYRSGR